MPHSRTHWIKLYIEILDDPKVGLLPDAIKWRFTSALLLAGELNDDGFLPPVDEMAWRLHTQPETLQGEMRMLAGRGLVELRLYDDDSERWYIPKFGARQAPSSNAERQREWRNRNGDRNKSVTATVTKRYANVTPEYRIQNTDTETEINNNNRARLAARFRELTAITPNESTPSYVTNWQEPLTSFLEQADGDIDRAIAAMESAVETARRPGNGKRAYTVASPKSIATFYANIIAGQHARGDADNAARLWQTAIDSIAARNWTDEYLRRAVTKVGGASRLKAISEREQPELAQELYREYKRLHTAA